MTEEKIELEIERKILEEDSIENVDEKFKSLYASPTFHGSIHEKLPKILKQIVSQFDSEREKDMALLSAITMISGCISNVSTDYGKEVIYTNLYSFIIAPPASGKGVMSNIKQNSFMPLHNNIKETHSIENDIKENNSQKIVVGKTVIQSSEMLFIPANASSAALVEQLKDSNGKGILCETEADTVSDTLKQDWGGYSDILRKAFHHEDISSLRKGNNGKELIEISKPKLSVCLTGTPSQIMGIIPNVENGLFSRFIYYIFINEQKWQSPLWNKNKSNKNELFESGKYIIELENFYKQNEYEFSLNAEQKKQFDVFFERQCSNPIFDDKSNIFRLGVIFIRISMIFSSLRHFDNNNESLNIECNDEDFLNVIELCKVFIEHSQLLYNIIKKNKFVSTDRRKQMLFDKIPKKKLLKRRELVEIGEMLGLGESTIDKYKKEWQKEGILKNESYGHIMKP